MLRVLALLLVGIAAGFGLSRLTMPTLEVQPSPQPMSSEAISDLERIASADMEDYHRLQKLEEKYAKADEMLGKVYLILLANLGLRLSEENANRLRESAQGRPAPLAETNRDPISVADSARTQQPPRDETAREPRPTSRPSPVFSKTAPVAGAQPFSSISFRRHPGCEGMPKGWFASRSIEGDYDVGVESSESGEPISYIHSVSRPRRPLELAQCGKIGADSNQPKRVRFSLEVKGEEVTGGVRIFIRPQGGREGTRNLWKGNFDWKLAVVEAEVHPQTPVANYGITLHGPGKLWIRKASFQELD